jgi:hypothetical protein
MSPLCRGVRVALLYRPIVSAGAAPAPVNFLTLLSTMDLVYRGEPFVAGHAKGNDLQTMDLAFRGQPFVTYRKSS